MWASLDAAGREPGNDFSRFYAGQQWPETLSARCGTPEKLVEITGMLPAAWYYFTGGDGFLCGVYEDESGRLEFSERAGAHEARARVETAPRPVRAMGALRALVHGCFDKPIDP